MEVVRDGGADHLAHCLANTPDKQAEAPSPSNIWGNGRVTSKGSWTRGCPSKHIKEQTKGRNGRTRKFSSYREWRRNDRVSRRGNRIVGRLSTLSIRP